MSALFAYWASSLKCCNRSCTWKHSPMLLHRPAWFDVLTRLGSNTQNLSEIEAIIMTLLCAIITYFSKIIQSKSIPLNYHIGQCPATVRSSKPSNLWRVLWRRDWPMPNILANERLQTRTSPKNHLVFWLCILLLLDDSSVESEPESDPEESSPVARGPLRAWIDQRSPSWAGLLKFQKNSQIWSSNATETRCQHLGKKILKSMGPQCLEAMNLLFEENMTESSLYSSSKALVFTLATALSFARENSFDTRFFHSIFGIVLVLICFCCWRRSSS